MRHHKAPLGSFSNTVIFRNRNTFELFFFQNFCICLQISKLQSHISLKLKQRVKSSNKNLQISDYAVCKSLINTVKTGEQRTSASKNLQPKIWGFSGMKIFS